MQIDCAKPLNDEQHVKAVKASRRGRKVSAMLEAGMRVSNDALHQWSTIEGIMS